MYIHIYMYTQVLYIYIDSGEQYLFMFMLCTPGVPPLWAMGGADFCLLKL